MNREHEREILIDLGAVSAETRGTPVGKDDNQGSLIPRMGLDSE